MIKILKLIILIIIMQSTIYAGEITAGKKYKVNRSLYLSAWYDDLAEKKLSKETASAYLYETRNADRPYIAFQYQVKVGTIITIVSLAPKPWYLYFNSDHYFVKLEPDLSQGLDVKLPLNSLLQEGLGDFNGLNPKIFSPMD